MAPSPTPNAARRQRMKSDIIVSIGLSVILLFFVFTSIVSYYNIRVLIRDANLVAHTHEVIIELDDLMSMVKDAETGQRGFVLTGKDAYLVPYKNAVEGMDSHLERIATLTLDNPRQQERLPPLRTHITAKLAELKQTVDLRRDKGFDAALAIINNDSGKGEMDAIRQDLITMQEEETTLRGQRLDEMDRAYSIAVVSGFSVGVLGVLLSLFVAYLLRRANAERYRQEWLQNGQVGLTGAMFGDQRLEALGENILGYLATYLDAHAGAFFVKEGDVYRRTAMHGVPSVHGVPGHFSLKDGLLGQVAKDGRTVVMHDVPDGYLTVGSGLGQSNPRHLVIAAATLDDKVNAVIELGFVHALDEMTLALLDVVAQSIGVAIRSALYRANLQNLLEETQRQSEELQSQSEELRVNNEELEEQSRALRESQARLEQQQVEMEQTNSQLEEQTQLLETQRDDLSRANSAVVAKAQELEQASQYKSDFLANMSHELRTPLNSSLILAKLLADNTQGNLTDEQIKFAQTIQSSGNDLLALINDILDLSKIEAGHMEVRPENVSVQRLLNDLVRLFEPVAKEKGLSFTTHIETGCPGMLETDRQRVEQVLKNLLSNALKFTETGGVEVKATATKEGGIAFAVTDTGIGIAANQQQAIFDAFRQADGTISRKFGGTGLGLSISRELTRLLGGTITITSTLGQGSSFTVHLPIIYDAARIGATARPHATQNTPTVTITRVPPAPAPRAANIEDDREVLTGNRRIILVIEDDQSFARILYDLAHELDFHCLIAHNAEDGLALAKQYIPSAVLLDVGLPDNSGLSVLDRLKHDARTRHVPVHVLSAGDYAQTALSLGAMGYMLKPVKREALVDTFNDLQEHLTKRLRRVLIVEDDPVQQDSVRKLLLSREVETLGAGSAAECLELLKHETFDCMVLDLSLPDASGYQLLETLSNEDSYSFPPVIVYTGRDLSADEEQRLRRYSKSIIIKGAKSPERLLDEVTLFLHQVVSELPAEQQRMIELARNRDAMLENRRILLVEDDVRNVYALTSILEPRGAIVQIARNGREALEALKKTQNDPSKAIDLVLMDVMMPEMDGMTATREIRTQEIWKKLPIIMLTAKAMKDDQERCLDAGANDYMAKPVDVEKLLSLVRVWMPR